MFADGEARFGKDKYRCALGRGGVRADKFEGDGATPAGVWSFRSILYRADRVRLPQTNIRTRAIAKIDAWCDAPTDSNYNRAITLPYPASTESLWREDELYDVVLVVGYNDNPVVPDLGSAIFVHVARANYSPTAGCVALAKQNLLEVVAQITRSSRLIVHPARFSPRDHGGG